MDLVGGVVDSRGGYVSKILYVKTKELGPLGGRTGRPPRSAIALDYSHMTSVQSTLGLIGDM